jgi:ATP-dependent DNA helicase RecG
MPPIITPTELRAIIEAGETFTVEFKGEERSSLNDGAVIENAVCLANGRGGLLLIGVEDDGRITGARPRHGAYTDVNRLEALISNRTVPPCPVTCELQQLDGHDIIMIHVPANLPVTATSDGLFKRRGTGGDGKPNCMPFHFLEMQSREGRRSRIDPSSRFLPQATWNDLDPIELERLRQTIQAHAGRADSSLLALSDIDIIKALGLGEGAEEIENLTLAAILMVGRQEAIQRYAPAHEVAFQVRQGTRLAVNEFMRSPLIRISEELTTRFEARNQEQEIQMGALRVGIPDYSRAGYREAVHNSLVHRDYGKLGAIHVQWYEEHLDISNPGGFVEGVTLDNLLVVAPTPRNRLLADAFKRIGLVERSGRGVDTIYEGQLRYGRPIPDYSQSTNETVQVILNGGPANLALFSWIMERDTDGRRVTVDDMLIINTIERERRLDIPSASRLIQRSEAAARALLERLVERGVLESRRQGNTRSYSLSPESYRAIGQATAYTRSAGFDSIRQTNMVLQHVASHGRITRSEAAELCGINSLEARALLTRLTQEGYLRLIGERRGSYYIVPVEEPPF